MVNFEKALPLLREGKPLTRESWKTTGPLTLSLEHGEFYYMTRLGEKVFVPVLTAGEILGDDWLVAVD